MFLNSIKKVLVYLEEGEEVFLVDICEIRRMDEQNPTQKVKNNDAK